MRYSILRTAAAAVIFIFLSSVSLQGEEKKKSDYILGLKGGYSFIEGYYGGQIQDSYYSGFYFLYSNPNIFPYVMGEFDGSFSRYNLKNSSGSYMSYYSLNLGLLLNYPLVDFLQIYGGASFKGAYLDLDATRTGKSLHTFKPGLTARAGFFFILPMGARLRAGFDYDLLYLSGKPFHGFQLYGGVSYNFNPNVRHAGVEPLEERVERLHSLGTRELDKRNMENAEDFLRQAVKLDPDHRESRKKLDLIEETRADFNRAEELMKRGRNYGALNIYLKVSKYTARADSTIAEARSRLAGEIPFLEKRGVQLYEQKQYLQCLRVMERLLVIDPDNSTARIYLPRAKNRYEALQKLR